MRIMLNFVGVGVQKAATTWLFQCLMEHPHIRGASIPKNKELNFFNYRYDRGSAWYHGLFSPLPGIKGEFSVRYFNDQNCPQRIHSYNPAVKLILSLRNPLERAYSQHCHEFRRGRLPPSLYRFEDAAGQNPSYLDQGRYATHLERWLKFFDLSQFHIVFFEEIRSDPEGVIRELFRWLGVDPGFRPPSLLRKANVSRGARTRIVPAALLTLSGGIRRLFGPSGVRLGKATGIPRLIRSLNEYDIDPLVIPDLSAETRQRFRAEFAGEIDRLARILNRDLDLWLK